MVQALHFTCAKSDANGEKLLLLDLVYVKCDV